MQARVGTDKLVRLKPWVHARLVKMRSRDGETLNAVISRALDELTLAELARKDKARRARKETGQ